MFDARTNAIFTIKQTDITKAERKSNDHCAAALAICRDLHSRETRVYLSRILVKQPNGSWLRYTTPSRLARELIALDRGGRMEVGDFILRAPTASQKLGYRPARKHSGSRTGKGPRPHHVTGDVRPSAPKGRTPILE
jgi:hypothetical protein